MSKRIILSTALVCFLITIGLAIEVQAQKALKPRPSPLVIKTITYEDTYVKINYGAPHKRDREVFGQLVPYGKVWRTGANEATEITFTKDVKVGGENVKAGTYTIFSIPEEDNWTIIFNSKLGQWGAYDYDESKNMFTFKVPVEKNTTEYEAFTIEFDQDGNKAYCKMMWDQTMVKFPIEFM